MDHDGNEIDPAAQALLNTFMAMAELLEIKGLVTRQELADHLAAKHEAMQRMESLRAASVLVGHVVQELRRPG